MTLRLNLKGEYFDEIKAGRKPLEYRLASKWEHRLQKPFTDILLLRGYPKRGDESKMLRRPWKGYEIQEITHYHFGEHPVIVCAIDVTP